MPAFENVSINPGKYHDYRIKSNTINAFCLGDVGSPDDFFLIGAEPDPSSNFPLLSGNLLNSEGELLFRLLRNEITLNPGNCSKIIGDHIGYEIHDSNDVKIFGVKTIWSPGSSHPDSKLVTYLTGNFYDKQKNLAVRAESINPAGESVMELNTKFYLGFNGSFFTLVSHEYSENEGWYLASVLSSRGMIHEPIRGEITGETINLDGKVLIGTTLNKCMLIINSTNFSSIGKCKFIKCKFEFRGEALQLLQFADKLKRLADYEAEIQKRKNRAKKNK